MGDSWPEDEVLVMLVRESAEHKRAWALIAGLSKALIEERRYTVPDLPKHLVGKKPENWSDRIQTLEERIVKQRKQLAALEDETEQMLVTALKEIQVRATGGAAMICESILATFDERRGPRPVDNVT